MPALGCVLRSTYLVVEAVQLAFDVVDELDEFAVGQLVLLALGLGDPRLERVLQPLLRVVPDWLRVDGRRGRRCVGGLAPVGPT